jgi:hypothetical protein
MEILQLKENPSSKIVVKLYILQQNIAAGHAGHTGHPLLLPSGEKGKPI